MRSGYYPMGYACIAGWFTLPSSSSSSSEKVVVVSKIEQAMIKYYNHYHYSDFKIFKAVTSAGCMYRARGDCVAKPVTTSAKQATYYPFIIQTRKQGEIVVV